MSREPKDILADKILAETGSGHERYAAEQRLMDDYEEYAESRARVHALEKKYAEIEAEEERRKAGLSLTEYRWYRFLNTMSYTLILIGVLCSIFGVLFLAVNPDSNLLTIGILILAVSWVLDRVSRKKLNR